jgi:hypothetical protein
MGMHYSNIKSKYSTLFFRLNQNSELPKIELPFWTELSICHSPAAVTMNAMHPAPPM